MSENCDTGLWRRILRTGLSEGGLTFYELDMVKVNSSDDSSRCLVKSGRIMTGRAKYSRESEGGEVSSVWSAEDSFQPFQDQWEEYTVFSPKENKVTLTFPGGDSILSS